MIDVPFEQAVKYHRWIGNLTVLLVALHGILYGVYYGVIHEVHMVNDHQIPSQLPVLQSQPYHLET